MEYTHKSVATARWWTPVLWAILAFVGLDVLMRRFEVEVPPPGTLRIQRAERVGETGADPPPADAPGWVERELPDAFMQAGQAVYVAWYRLRVELDPALHQVWAIYLRRPENVVAVRVNGQPVGDAGTTRDPLPHYLADLRFPVPAALLRPGANEILIRTARVPDYGYLGEVWIGDDVALGRMQAGLERVGRDFARMVAATVAALALLHGAFFLLRRREPEYGWFAAALAMWALHCAWPLFDVPPIPIGWWWPLSMVSLGWFTICAACFSHRFLGLRRPRVERGLLAWGVVGSVILWTPSLLHRTDNEIFANWLWVPGVLAIGAYIAIMLLSGLRGRPGLETRLIASFALFLLLVGVRDWLYDWDFLASGNGRYFRYAGSLVLLVFGTVMLRRFVAALDDSERLNRELEARVEEGRELIAANFRRIAQMEQDRVRLDERERLMRDMHDGIGGQLVQALAMSERAAGPERMHEVIQACLDDLRLLIDASVGGDEGLGAVLASLRNRIRRRLEGSGLAIDWPPGDLARLPALTPHRSLQLVRVLQEALSNVIKHAGATRVSVRCAVSDADGGTALLLEVVDDGRGMDPDAPPGRGLDNMRRRATELGGTLSVEGGAGTCVRLRVPLE